MVNEHASWHNSTGGKSKKHDKMLTQNWNMIPINLMSFFDWVSPTEWFLYLALRAKYIAMVDIV